MSHLSFLPKLLERIVQIQLQTFFDGKSLMLRTQSAYHQFHSIETLTMMVYYDGVQICCYLQSSDTKL